MGMWRSVLITVGRKPLSDEEGDVCINRPEEEEDTGAFNNHPDQRPAEEKNKDPKEEQRRALDTLNDSSMKDTDFDLSHLEEKVESVHRPNRQRETTEKHDLYDKSMKRTATHVAHCEKTLVEEEKNAQE
jgi:hypothetical protein